MTRLRLAIIADVHGNARALEAVRADIAPTAPDLLVDLGDRFAGPLWPAETAQLFADMTPVGVRGNHDRRIACDPRAGMYASDAYAFDRLSPDEREALGALPLTAAPCAGVLAFHARPDHDEQYFGDRIVSGRLVDADPAAVDHPALAGVRLALCGHSHRAYATRIAPGCILVNPGSVGCPAYEDDTPPEPHVAEGGLPHARWALVDIAAGGVGRIELRSVVYDWEAAAAQAERNGRADWAHALRFGSAPRH